MPSKLKRKGSPSLEEDAESSKRRFAEAEGEEGGVAQLRGDAVEEVDTSGQNGDTAATDSFEDQPAKPTSNAGDKRASRFAALRARNAASRKSNLAESKNEARRTATDPGQLTSLQRKKDIAEHKLLKASVEDSGEDFERKRAWDWTVEESERWDEKMAKKRRRKEDVGFADYSREAGKVYERQIGQMGKADGGPGGGERKEAYEREKEEAIERAVRSGGLEIVETENGELIAVDQDGSFYSTADNLSTTLSNKPDQAAVDRLVNDIKKAEEVRLRRRKERGRGGDDDGGDVNYINEKNKQFNLKLARFYDKYTADIRESFERGTAI